MSAIMKYLSSILIVSTIFVSSPLLGSAAIKGSVASSTKEEGSSKVSTVTLKTEKLSVKGMTCSNCEKRIHDTLMKIEGIDDVQAHNKTNTVSVKFDAQKVSLDKIVSTIRDLGYKVQ